MATDPAPRPQVHLLCGLPGAGKTTHARRLESQVPAVRFTLDEWMLRLHGLHYDHPDYPAHAETCQDLIWDVARQVLATGHDVVLDWNQWSRKRRRRWRERAEDAGYPVLLHHVEVPVETAVAQAQGRTETGADRSHHLDADGVRHLASIFEHPSPEEGLRIHTVSWGDP